MPDGTWDKGTVGMKILITGAGGFIGRNLIAALRTVAARGICLPVGLRDEASTVSPAVLDGVGAVDLALLWMALLGRQPAAIRASLGLTDQQVAPRLASLYQRLQAGGRVQALWTMAQIGLHCPMLPEPLTVAV